MADPVDERMLAIARAYCLTRYTYPPAAGYVSPEAWDRHIDKDARATMRERWWQMLAPLLIAEGRRQAAQAVRDGWASAPVVEPLPADLVPTLVEYCAQLAAGDFDHAPTEPGPDAVPRDRRYPS